MRFNKFTPGANRREKLETLNAKHVLVVEDNFHLRRILGGALERRGYTVSEAATGEEAIVKASNENPKLILLDLSLPDMTGTEAARALKQNPQTAHIPIVGCGTYFESEGRDQALDSAMAGFVQKPVPLRDIEGVIEQFIILER
jgi:CheY-like chemotaxis protein